MEPNPKNKKRCVCNASKTSPCPKALERIHAMQAESTSKGANLAIDQGCDWYVNSAEYGYSFWNLAKDLHGSPLSDREICQLLLISQAQLKETYESAIKKLASQRDEPYMQEFLETIQDLAASKETDNTTYMPDSFRDKISGIGDTNENSDESSEENEEKGKKRGRKKIKGGLGMPIHRSGTKTDIWGITSKSTRERLQKEQKKK